MWKCAACGKDNQDNRTHCWSCTAGKDGAPPKDPLAFEEMQRQKANRPKIARTLTWREKENIKVILSTTPFVPGHRIKSVLGIVSGEAIEGANIFSDMLADVRDIVGGRAGSYENKLKDARKVAIGEMVSEAKDLGCNAIVGIQLNYESIRGTMLMVAVCGTAILVEPESDES